MRGRRGNGRNRYDSKGFKGNLMPIRKKMHSGPGVFYKGMYPKSRVGPVVIEKGRGKWE